MQDSIVIDKKSSKSAIVAYLNITRVTVKYDRKNNQLNPEELEYLAMDMCMV